MASKRPVATRRTMRLRKLECSNGCPFIARVSARAMTLGLPACPCGGTLWPAELEDAVAILPRELLDTHPAWLEYMAECDRFVQGQKGPGRAVCAISFGMRSPEAVAAERVRERERECAHANRLAALAPLRGPDPSSDPIPF